MFNLDPEKTDLFQDKRVRQALLYALDRDSITKNIFFGYGEAAMGTQPPMSPAYAPDRMIPPYDYDPEKAKSLLTEAGWTLKDGVMQKDGEKLEIDFVYITAAKPGRSAGDLHERSLGGIGVKLNVQNLSSLDVVRAVAIRRLPDGAAGQLGSQSTGIRPFCSHAMPLPPASIFHTIATPNGTSSISSNGSNSTPINGPIC